MTTWTVVEESPDFTVSISPEARYRYEQEQREARTKMQIRVGSIAGAVAVIAGLLIEKLIGA
jgi:hypothetical protein